MPAPTPQGTPATRDNSVASTTYAADSPSGIAEGEKLVAWGKVGSGATAVALTDLQGWTSHGSVGGIASGFSFLLTKDATSGDAATAGGSAVYNFAGDGNFPSKVSVLRVQASTVDDAEVAQISQGFAWTLPSATTLGADRLILYFVSANQSPTYTWSSATEFIESVTAGRTIAAAHENLASAGSTSQTATSTLSIGGQGAVLALFSDTTPPAAPTGLTATMIGA